MRAATLATLATTALGHGTLQLPPSWNNKGGVYSTFLKPGMQAYPGAGDQGSTGCTGKALPTQY